MGSRYHFRGRCAFSRSAGLSPRPPASLLVRRPLSSSAVLHVVNASPSSADRPGTRSALLSSSAVLSCEVKMLVIATAALLALSATAEAATIKYNHESRDTHDSDEPSYQHKRGFYYLDLQGKRINDVSSWLPTWSYSVEPSYTHESKTQSVEPSHTHEPSKPAYKEFHVPQATTKDNSQHGTNAMRKTTPKTAKTTGTTTTTPTYRRKRRSVRYVKSRPMYKQPHKYRSVRSVPSRPMYKQSYKHERRHKRSTGDNDETLMRLADALSLVTQSLLGQDGANREAQQSLTETPAQGQDESEETVDEPEATVEVEPEATVDEPEATVDEPEATVDEPEATVEVEPEATVDFPDEDQEDEEDEVSIDDDEEDDDEEDEDGDKDGDEEDKDGDKDGDEDEEDGDEDDEVDSDDEVDFKQEDPEEEPEEEPKKPKKKSKKPKKKSKKPKKSKKQNKKSKKLKEKPEEPEDTMDSDMDYYGYDGYPDYTHKPRKFRQSYRQSRPSYDAPAYRYKRSARGMRVSKSQAKKDGQKKMKKNKYKGRKH